MPDEHTRGIGVRPDDRPSEQVALYERLWAVVIGIDEYPNLDGSHQLERAVNDARGVSRVLREDYGFDTVFELYDGDATDARVNDVLRGELRQTGENDAVLVYFAGHGYTEDTRFAGPLGHLVTHDGGMTQETLRHNLTMRSLGGEISEAIRAKHVLFVADACYSGLMTRGSVPAPRRDVEYLRDISALPVRQILAAGRAGETVLDSGPGGHSVFTGSFLGLLNESSDYLTGLEIGAAMPRRVREAIGLRDHQQNPQFGRLAGEGDFVLVRANDAESYSGVLVAETSAAPEPSPPPVLTPESVSRNRPWLGVSIGVALVVVLGAWGALSWRQAELAEVERKAEMYQVQEATKQQTVSRNMKTGIAALGREEHREAIDAFEGVLDASPEHSQAITMLREAREKYEAWIVERLAAGRVALERQAYGEAKVQAREVLGVEPGHDDARALLSSVDAAREDAAQKAIEIGRRAVGRGDYAGAVAPLKAALRHDRENEVAKDLLNTAESKQRDRIKKYTDHITAGKTALESGDWGSAITSYVAALDLQRKDPNARRLLSEARRLKGIARSGMVIIPSGAFRMGSTRGDSDEKVVHSVQVDLFLLDQHEITVGEYRKHRPFYTPSWNSNTTNQPATNVSWHAAKEYCESVGKRLPSEAEWEKACRGPEGDRWSWENNAVGSKGRYGMDLAAGSVNVGSFAANGYGLHDMSGNVWEWTSDWYGDDYYRKSPSQNPSGPSSGDYRVLRGGSWGSSAIGSRCAKRNYHTPWRSGASLGFRCAALSP